MNFAGTSDKYFKAWNPNKVKIKQQKRENFHFDVQLTTFVFLCHTMFCVDINIVII